MAKGNVRLEVQYDIRYSTAKGNVRSGHDDPKNYQNDQSITRFSGKLSGHYDPKNDPSD